MTDSTNPGGPANKVLLFASLREAAGTGAVEVEAETLAVLVTKVCDRFGDPFRQICLRAVTAVDGESIPRAEWATYELDGSQEVAILPPVSGGSDVISIDRSSGGQATAAVLTISDRCSAGETEDTSGPAIIEFLESEGYEVTAKGVVPDESDLIREKLEGWADFKTAQLIVTTGGTGLGPRDVTPEATRAVVEREAPGIGELMRSSSDTTRAYLSRQVAGVRNGCLIVNLPGSRAAAIECLVATVELFEHAIHAASGGNHEAPQR